MTAPDTDAACISGPTRHSDSPAAYVETAAAHVPNETAAAPRSVDASAAAFGIVETASAAASPVDAAMTCRAGCAACCIAPSISSPIPGMPHGKPAGMPCVQLDDDLRCRLFGDPARPAVCASLRPSPSMCGASRTQALAHLAELEAATAPGGAA